MSSPVLITRGPGHGRALRLPGAEVRGQANHSGDCGFQNMNDSFASNLRRRKIIPHCQKLNPPLSGFVSQWPVRIRTFHVRNFRSGEELFWAFLTLFGCKRVLRISRGWGGGDSSHQRAEDVRWHSSTQGSPCLSSPSRVLSRSRTAVHVCGAAPWRHASPSSPPRPARRASPPKRPRTMTKIRTSGSPNSGKAHRE